LHFGAVFAAHSIELAPVLPADALQLAVVLSERALQRRIVVASQAIELAPVIPDHTIQLAPVIPEGPLQRRVVVAAYPIELALQFGAHPRDLGFCRFAGLAAGPRFGLDALQLRLERRGASRGFIRQPLAFRGELLLRALALGVTLEFRRFPRGGHCLFDPLLYAGFQFAAQLLFGGLPLQRRGFARALLPLRLGGGDRLVEALIELVAQALLAGLVLERGRIPALDFPVAPRGSDFVLQPLLEFLPDALFGGLPLVIELLAETLLGGLPFGRGCLSRALFPLRLGRRDGVGQLVIEFLPQLLLEGLPFRGGRGASALLAIRTCLGDQVRHVRLHLLLDRGDARFRRALRLLQGLLTRFRNLPFVLLLEGGELLVERASQLRLQIVKGHRG